LAFLVFLAVGSSLLNRHANTPNRVAIFKEKPELSREEYRRLARENNQRRQWDYRQD
jgi:hypothetical protein